MENQPLLPRPVLFALLALLVVASRLILPSVGDGLDNTWVVVCSIACVISLWLVNRASRPALWSGLPTLIQPAHCFVAFYCVLFLAPYVWHVLGWGDLTRNRFLVPTYFEHANRALVLATFGMLSFALGTCWARRAGGPVPAVVKHDPADSTSMLGLASALFLLSIALFFATGASQIFAGEYTGLGVGNAALDGIYFLTVHFAMLLAAVALSTMQLDAGRNVLSLLCVAAPAVWALAVLASGDRNNFLLIALLYAGWLFTYRVRARLPTLLLLAAAAWVLYQAVEVARSSGGRDLTSILVNLFSTTEVPEANEFDQSSFALTTITSRAAFVDDAEAEGLFHGYFKLVGLLGVLPFSRQLLPVPSNGHYTSAQYLTELILGSNPTWSLGSNIVSDLSLDFGATGLILVMCAMGSAMRRLQEWAATTISVPSMVLYSVVLSLAFQWPRYSFDFPVRSIAWTLLFFLMVRLMTRHRLSGTPC